MEKQTESAFLLEYLSCVKGSFKVPQKEKLKNNWMISW
jgi:hypothetical protein